jgi:hypothetical protein
MRWHVQWTPAAALPAREAVLDAQDLPGPDDLPPRLARLLDDARREFLDLATPCAIVEDITADAFQAVLRAGVGGAMRVPLDDVLDGATGLALFVATIGPGVPAAIAGWFAGGDPARGYMLDAVASAAADGLALAAAREWVERRFGGCAPGWCALPYSPGYCGWNVRGQRALFDALAPVESGVQLNESCLMQPLKSVSGVIVHAPAAAHRMGQNYPCCDTCLTRDCEGRVERSAAEAGGAAGPGMCS